MSLENQSLPNSIIYPITKDIKNRRLAMRSLRKALQEIADGGWSEFSLMSYSGRAMYGKQCLAITGDNLNPIEIGIHLGLYAEQNGLEDEILQDVRGMRSDSLGLGSVLYWPNVPFEEISETEDEEG